MFASLTKPVLEFLSWWKEELTELLPVRVSDDAQKVPRIVIGIEGGDVRLIEWPQVAGQPLADDALMPAAAMGETLAALLQDKPQIQIALRVPYKSCFSRSVTLPQSASADFERLLIIDLERATPFKARDVYHAFLPGTAAGPRLAALRQLVIKRSIVDRAKGPLEQAGLTVGAIECWNETQTTALPVNFLRLSSKADTQRPLLVPLMAASLALAISAGWLALEQRETALGELQAQTSALKGKAQAHRDALAKSQVAGETISNFNALRREVVSRAAILEEISRILPDSAFITDLRVSGAVVDINGLATSASALVPLIENSPMFVDATSTAPLTFDPRENKERFGIRMRLAAVPSGTTGANDPARGDIVGMNQ